MTNNDDHEPSSRPPARTMTFGATMKAVFWSFFGVRKRRDYEHDAANLNPVHVILGGLIGVAVFIGILVFVVHMVVARN
jgi:hypothetical protein